MKLMKIFQIEIDYQKHKQRLSSIKSLDAKKKAVSITTHNINAINSFKKKRDCSVSFYDQEKGNSILQSNQLLHRSLTKVYDHDRSKKVLKGLVNHSNLAISRSSSQMSARTIASNRLQTENLKLTKKLNQAHSCYSKLRQDRYHRSTITESVHKQQIIKLLQKQLGCKPQVLFPTVRKNIQNKNKKKKNWYKFKKDKQIKNDSLLITKD